MSKGGKGELEKKEAPPDTWWSVYVCRARNPGLRCAGVVCVCERARSGRSRGKTDDLAFSWLRARKKNHTHAQFLNRSQLWDVWL